MIPTDLCMSIQSSNRNESVLDNGAILKREGKKAMANYMCAVRTNYFRVKDEAEFRELMGRVYGSEDNIGLWQKSDDDGNPVFGFGCYGGISGIINAREDEEEDVDETAYDEFITGLQKCVADDDAIIIFEVGNEKLRYLVGHALIITSNCLENLSLNHMATQLAAGMLEDDNWQTQCEY